MNVNDILKKLQHVGNQDITFKEREPEDDSDVRELKGGKVEIGRSPQKRNQSYT